MFPTSPDSEQIKQLEEKWLGNPRSRVFAQLADFYRKSGRAEEGIDICLEGLEYHRDYPQGYLVLGKCYREMECLGEAEKAFEKALDQDPTNLVALKLLGQVRERKGDRDEALRNYSDYLDLNPFDTVILHRREILLSSVPSEVTTGSHAPDGDDAPGDRGIPENPGPTTADEAIRLETPGETRGERDFPAAPTEISIPDAGGLREDDAGAVESSPADSPEVHDSGPDQDILATMTLARIYYKQGLLKRAREIYRRLLQKDPGNAVLNEKIAEIDARASSKHFSAGGESTEETPGALSKNSGLQGSIESLNQDFPSDVRQVGDDTIIHSGETDSGNNGGKIAIESFIETLDGKDASGEITGDGDLTFLPPETVIGKEFDRFALAEIDDVAEHEERSGDYFGEARGTGLQEDPEVVDFERWIRYIQF